MWMESGGSGRKRCTRLGIFDREVKEKLGIMNGFVWVWIDNNDKERAT